MPLVLSATHQASDLDLVRRVSHFLGERFIPSLRRLVVEADEGTVTVRGQVSSFYEKQVALHCCQRVAGVQRLVDAVDVESPILAAVKPQPVGMAR